MTKQELARLYGISNSTLRKLLNVRYYTQLLEHGYKREANYLSPRVLRAFYAIYGEPINELAND